MASKVSAVAHDKIVRLVWVRHAPVNLPVGQPWPVYGALDLPLAPFPQFGQQLTNLAAYIVRHYGALHGVWTSDQQRAIHTWQLLHRAGVTLVNRNDNSSGIIPHLREQNFGELEGYTLEQYTKRNPDNAHAISLDWVNNKAVGGESYADLHQRVGLGIQELLNHIAHTPITALPNAVSKAKTIPTFMVVSHGGVIRSMLGHVLGIPMAQLVHLEVRNLGLCVFTIQPTQCVPTQSTPPSLKYFPVASPVASPDKDTNWFWRMVHWNLTPEAIHDQ